MEPDCRYSFHLFAGAGGGILADLLSGREIVGAIEIEEYPRRVLLQRQADGMLPSFPIWDDVRSFSVDNEETKEYVEFLQAIREELVIAGGFPCQDISIAGKGKGIDGERSGLWGEMFRIISEIRPRHIFVENSPMLVVRGLDRVLGDLSEIGYDALWTTLPASAVGAPHVRDRFWLWGGCDLSKRGRHIPTPTVMDACDLAAKGRKATTEDNYRGVSLSFLVEKRPDKFWPTPRAQEPGSTSEGYGRGLAELVEGKEQRKRWPTPTCSDSHGAVSPERFFSYDRGGRMKRLSNLSNAVLYPTPGTTGLSNGSGNCEKANRLFENNVITEEERKAFRSGNGGKLNPDWVAWLMGWPIGWDDIRPMKKEAFDEWKERTLDGTWWSEDPAETGRIPRAVADAENRKKRLMALGNGQVPLCAYVAEKMLMTIFMEDK